MIRAYSVADVRASEARAMVGRPDGELMGRAARALADICVARLRARDGRRAVALVGSGDNGGDALYAVAHLVDAGFACAVVLTAPAGHAAGVDAVARRGVEVIGLPADHAHARSVIRDADLVLDGILGIGGRPGLSAPVEGLLDAVPADAYLVAVDLPSGHDPHGLEPSPGGVFADETVTFGAVKPLALAPPHDRAVGLLTEVDLGLDVVEQAAPVVTRLTHADVASLWPIPGPDDDKYSRGVLGVVAGSEAYPGAAVLATGAAVAAGVGMARYVGPDTPTAAVRHGIPEAVTQPGRVQAWLVGPGLAGAAEGDLSRAQRLAADEALSGDLPVVLDAGGLDLLTTVTTHRSAPTLLTPHAGEAARLLGRLGGLGTAEVSRADVMARPLASARRLADLTGATVLLKGATTLVVPPGAGPARSQADAPSWAGTAGSGDVLAGVVGMALAAGLSALDAGSLAALVHGVAADRANPGGPVSARMIVRALPGTIAALLSTPT